LTIETRSERLSGDPGAVLLREVFDVTDIVPWMTAQMKDDRWQAAVVHDLPFLLRTIMLLAARGWRDHDDADALRHDPAMGLAVSFLSRADAADGKGRSGLAADIVALKGDAGGTRKPTGSARGGAGACRPPPACRERWRTRITLDVDSLLIEVHSHQPQAQWNGHYRARIYHPLITSIAETGDMLDPCLRPGNVGTAPSCLMILAASVHDGSHHADRANWRVGGDGRHPRRP
jgi:hypothetical protein